MRHDSLERAVWLRVAGILVLTCAYLSIRGRIAGLDLLYKVLVVVGVTLIGTALVTIWGVNRWKSISALVVFTLIFAGYYGSVLYLWGTKWGVVPHAMFVLALVLGPLLILRRARQ